MGASPRFLELEPSRLEAAGVDPLKACPFNATWMSALDAGLARKRLAFEHEPLDVALASAVQAGLARWVVPPPSMAQRNRELRLARQLER